MDNLKAIAGQIFEGMKPELLKMEYDVAMLACEFGFKCAERGLNLDGALVAMRQVLDEKDRSLGQRRKD